LAEFWNDILTNLTYVGIGAALFLAAYLSNMAFSLYYNIKILSEKFDKDKIIDSCLKVSAIIVGLVLLCVSITSLPTFVDYVGLTIPQEYADIFSNLAILGLFVTSACKYVFEAYSKFKKILENGNIG
jgi:hypothetical protein